MPCVVIDDRIEALAEGDAPTAEEAAHLQACAACAARLALARRIDRALAARPAPPAPPTFTAAVLARIHRERWRAEQALDLGFNVAIGAGLLIIVAGVIGLVYASGLSAVSSDVVALVSGAFSQVAAGMAPALPAYLAATALVTTALAIWWWAERGFSF